MKKEIYFLFMTPPLVTYMERYCVNFFDQIGWITHVMDLSPFMNPQAYKVVTTGLIAQEKREIIFNKKQYRNYIKKTADGAVFLLACDFNMDTCFINRNVRKTQYYGYMSRKETDIEFSSPPIGDKVKRLWADFSLHRFAGAIFNRLPQQIFPMRAADFIVLGGFENRKLYIRLCLSDKHTIVKHIHSWDYEKYLEVKDSKKRIVEEPYCVYLDQFIPFHPDGVQQKLEINAESYYTQLENFFNKIEKKFSLKVVIAAHPRADYNDHPEIFRNNKIYRFKTAELVRDAEFVLAHYSMSICFAAMFKKPLLLLTLDAINGCEYIYKHIQKYSQLTGAPILNLNDELNENEIPNPTYDDNKYEEYIRRYLKSDYNTEEENEVSCAEQLLSLLENIMNK